MLRAERLMLLSDLLHADDTTTISALAEELAVTRRTVLRDLASLRARGLPITGEPGRGGGLRLERDRGAAAVHLTITEIAALWLAARLSREASDLPWDEAARSALAKLLGCLPPIRARELRALCRRVIIGPPASNHVRGTAGTPPRELLRIFDDAFAGRCGLAFGYTDRDGRRSRRRIEPHGLLLEPPVWYVLARDLTIGQPRMFRMDRVRASSAITCSAKTSRSSARRCPRSADGAPSTRDSVRAASGPACRSSSPFRRSRRSRT